MGFWIAVGVFVLAAFLFVVGCLKGHVDGYQRGYEDGMTQARLDRITRRDIQNLDIPVRRHDA